MRILFLGKAGHEAAQRGGEKTADTFPGTEIHFGGWGDPFPESAETWKGDYIISYLAPWIVPRKILAAAEIAAINFHPGPPEYPGIGCTNFAIYNDESEYGITCHHMAERVDTGSIIIVKRFPIDNTDTVSSLTNKCYGAIEVCFDEILDLLNNGTPLSTSPENWTRRPYRRSELNDLCHITPDMSANEVRRRIRATSFPGAKGAFIELHGCRFEYVGDTALVKTGNDSMRRIAVVTGARADYGLLTPLMRAIGDEPGLTLQVIAAGMHLLPEFGETWRQIVEDGFAIDAKVDMKIAGDSAAAIAKSIGHGTIGFADAWAKLEPDIVVLLGDRFETLAAANAAMVARIPIAHIHGGEATEGLIDEPIRHAVTKMAHLHFTAAEPYRRRVIQLGEDPARVFNVGALGLDNIRALNRIPRAALESDLGLSFGERLFVVTYHPVTLETGRAAEQADALLAALDRFSEATVVFTLTNADTEGRDIIVRINTWCAAHPNRGTCFDALGARRYLSLAAESDAVIGNSSSGLIEVPWLGVPTVDIGDRQRGRIAPPSVIHSEAGPDAIETAIHRALDPAFRETIAAMENPYGDGNAAARIVEVLREAELGEALVKKHFHDLPAEMAR